MAAVYTVGVTGADRRLWIAVSVVIAFAALIGWWAVRPLTDSVAVGTDWTPTLLDPPQGQQEIRQEVECNSLLSSTARPDEPLPTLTPQPTDKPPLAYRRPPCEFVHSDARRTFAIDVLAIVIAIGVLAIAFKRRRQDDQPLVAAALS